MSQRFKDQFVKIGLIAVFTSIAIGTAGAQSQGSGSGSSAQTYGAIAFGEGGGRYSSGWARNYPTQAEADSSAVSECGRSPCKVGMRFWGKYCGAVARGSNGAWGSASAASDDEAREKAETTCRGYGGRGCDVLASACNSQ